MNRKFIASLAASFALLGAANAYADVVYTRTGGLTTSTAWSASFGGGDAYLSFTGGATQESANTPGGIIQTFTGNGQVLEGFGIQANGSGASGTWSIALIDYGVVSPVRTGTAMNTVTSTVFADTFTATGYGSVSQLNFDFIGASRVTLQSDHQYGITIFASGGSGSQFINRGGDVYAGGSIGTGAIGAFATPGAGARTANFALYTSVAAVPEPSSFAAVAGLAAVGLAMSRRRKR